MMLRRLALVIVLLSCAPLRAPAVVNLIGQEPLAAGESPDFTAVADLNRDGHADVVVVDSANKLVQIYLADSKASARLVRGEAYSVGKWLVHVEVGDLDGDGTADIVCTDPNTPGLWILFGRGDGTFLPATFTSPSPAWGPDALALADVDGVNGLDLIFTDLAGEQVVVLLNDGGMPPSFQPAGTFDSSGTTSQLLAVDVSGDGFADIVSVTYRVGLAAQINVARFRGIVDGFPDFESPQHYTVDGKATDLVVAELVRLVNASLDANDASTCSGIEGATCVTIADVILAVHQALRGY